MPVYLNGVPTETAISIANGASIDQLQEAFDNLLYRGPHANQAAFPSTGVAGQFLLNLATDSLWVWDVEGNSWVETGVSGGQAGQNIATALQHYYDQVTGTGYGFDNAQPGRWELTPDGRAQCIGGSYGNASSIRFARLHQPGDRVVLNGMSISLTASSNQRRFNFVGVSAGEDPDFKSNQGAWANAGFSQISSTPGNLEFACGWIGAYFQLSSYGPGMQWVGGGSANVAPADIYDFDVEWRVRTDYRIEFLVDGVVRGLGQYVPENGVDLYFLASPTNILPAPAGEVTTTPGGTSSPSGAANPAYLSQVGHEGTLVASGGGYYLYENSTPHDPSDVSLTAAEAAVAANLRMFQDFSGMTPADVAEVMKPVAAVDREVLDNVQNLAVGWFHAQDLTLPEIQAKMAAYADGLAAANAGSVELTLASLQALPLQGGVSLTTPFLFHGGTILNGECLYAYKSMYGTAAFNNYGITYLYVRNYPQNGENPHIRVQFESLAQRDTFLNDVNTFHIEGHPSVVDFTNQTEPGGTNLHVNYAYPSAAAVLQDVYNNGMTLNLTIAESVVNDDDVLNAELIAQLTAHLSKFPR